RDAGSAARAAAVLADLRGGRAPQAAARHSRRFELPPSGNRARLADLLRGRLRGAGAGFSVAGREPDFGGRVRQIPGPQGGPHGVRGDVVARIPVALFQILARAAHRGALGRPPARGDRARELPPHLATLRCAGGARGGGTGGRAPAFRRYAALFLGFSPLAV